MAADERVAEVESLHANLGRATYYDVLGLRPGCDYVAVRDAFHAQAQRFHPDRYVLWGGEAKAMAYEIYKRMTEAFNVLSDPELRAAYDEARIKGLHRLSDTARARRMDADEQHVANSFARIYLRSAKAKLAREDVRGAWIDIQLGLGLEQAPPLLALLEQLRRHPAADQALGAETLVPGGSSGSFGRMR